MKKYEYENQPIEQFRVFFVCKILEPKMQQQGVLHEIPAELKDSKKRSFATQSFSHGMIVGPSEGFPLARPHVKGDGDELLWSFKAGQHIWAHQAHHKQQKMWTPFSKWRDVFYVHLFKLTQNHVQKYLQCVQYSSSVIESVVITHVTRPNVNISWRMVYCVKTGWFF